MSFGLGFSLSLCLGPGFSLSLGLSLGFCLRPGLGFSLGLSLSSDLVLVSITYKTRNVTNIKTPGLAEGNW